MDVDFCYNTDFPITSKLNTKDIYCCIFDSNKASISGYLKINTDDFEYPNQLFFYWRIIHMEQQNRKQL